MTKAEVLRPEAGREPGGARDCGSFVRRVRGSSGSVWFRDKFRKGSRCSGVRESPTCARLGLLQAPLDVAVLGPVPSSLPREPPRVSAMASTSTNLQVGLFSHPPGGLEARSGGRGRGRRRAAPSRWSRRPVLSARFRGLPLAFGDS